MKITIALPMYAQRAPGGFLVHIRYAELLASRGHEVVLIFPRRVGEMVSSLRSRIEEPLWALRTRYRHRPLVPSLAPGHGVKVRLRRNLTRDALPDADILIATAWQTAEALAHAPPRCGRKFYIVYDYEYLMTVDAATRTRIENTYRMPFGIISTSKVVDETVRQYGGTPLGLVACGLDFESFGVDVPCEQRNALTVGFPMRQEPFKGAADAIAAVSLLRERYGTRLNVTAFGSRKGALPDWITWLDYPSNQRLREFYNAQSVFLLPSHFEGWGLPGAEAMACGAALVTADNGGCRDYAFDNEDALVVPPRDPAAFADAIGRLFDDDRLRHRLAHAGTTFVQRFTWENAITQLVAVIGA